MDAQHQQLICHLVKLTTYLVMAEESHANGRVCSLSAELALASEYLERNLPTMRRWVEKAINGQSLPEGIIRIADAEAMIGPGPRL
jgi:hypothetical protein